MKTDIAGEEELLQRTHCSLSVGDAQLLVTVGCLPDVLLVDGEQGFLNYDFLQIARNDDAELGLI